MNKTNYLLIRNIRGNWPLRLLYEFSHNTPTIRTFGYINLIGQEYFPPHKPARLLISARLLEKLISKIFFINPLPRFVEKNFAKEGKIHKLERFNLLSIRVVLKLLKMNNSEKLQNMEYRGIPFGQFIHTTLIAKYGVKHFRINRVQFLSNFNIFMRFLIAFNTILNILNKYNYDTIVLINGRDSVGVGSQLAAFIKSVNVTCLENDLSKPNIPKFGEWGGNMHHWKVREFEMLKTLETSNLTAAASIDFIKKQFSYSSRTWGGREIQAIPSQLLRQDYVCFFTTSEKETTTCPTGIPTENSFDNFDQSQILKSIYQILNQTNYQLVIRLHPNFSKTRVARNEMNYFVSLTKSWKNTIIIGNESSVDSYQLAMHSKLNFIFRSSIAAELACRGLVAFHTAPAFWSILCPDKVAVSQNQLTDLILNKKRSRTSHSADFFGFASMYQSHGKEFKKFKFMPFDEGSRDKRVRKYKTYVDDIELEIPRFSIYQFRE